MRGIKEVKGNKNAVSSKKNKKKKATVLFFCWNFSKYYAAVLPGSLR